MWTGLGLHPGTAGRACRKGQITSEQGKKFPTLCSCCPPPPADISHSTQVSSPFIDQMWELKAAWARHGGTCLESEHSGD